MKSLKIPAPVVDYREFRPSRINEPRFEHLKLLWGWVVYFVLYFLTENLIPVSSCHIIHCRLDDIIPFNEYFLIFYCFWYILIFISLLYFLLYDIHSFRHLQIFIMITQAVAMIIYIVYPSIQLLRPEVMPHDNALCSLMLFIYNFDTPTGVCPSLHVAYSIGIASVWTKCRKASKGWKAFIVFSTVMICISVMFVKQHSAVDVAAAIALGAFAEYIVYNRYGRIRRKQAKLRMRKLALRLAGLR